MKYTKDGEVKHIIDIEETEEGKFLKCAVKDTGLGIKKKDKDKLFKLYGQIKNNKGLNENGSGLGLVIIQKIITQFGGTIEYESKYGEGSIFTFTFKLKDAKY